RPQVGLRVRTPVRTAHHHERNGDEDVDQLISVLLLDGPGAGKTYNVADERTAIRLPVGPPPRAVWQEGDVDPRATIEIRTVTYIVKACTGPIPYRREFYVATVDGKEPNPWLFGHHTAWWAPLPMSKRTKKTPWIHLTDRKSTRLNSSH